MAKKLSTEEKMAIILEGLRHEKSVSQICREHGISQAQYYKWREWLKALGKALNEGYSEGVRGERVTLVSDNGSQPTSVKFLKECQVLGIKQVFTSYNNPKRNANTERYFRTYKEEVARIQKSQGSI